MKNHAPSTFAAALAVAFSATLLASPCLAQSATPSLDEMLSIPAPGASGKTSGGSATQPSGPKRESAGVPIDAGVARRLTGEQASDSLRQALGEMLEASDRLGKNRDTGVQTQRIQESVLEKLAQVIEAAEKQQQQSSSSSSSSSSSGSPKRENGSDKNAAPQPGGQPGQKEGKQPGEEQGDQDNPDGKKNGKKGENRGGNPGRTDPRQISPSVLEQVRSEWGNLPPRLRDDLLEGLTERVSPVYKEMTERYYQRLAEEGK